MGKFIHSFVAAMTIGMLTWAPILAAVAARRVAQVRFHVAGEPAAKDRFADFFGLATLIGGYALIFGLEDVFPAAARWLRAGL